MLYLYVLAILSLGACSDNPTGPGSDLVGSWRLISGEVGFDLSEVDLTLKFYNSGSLKYLIDAKDGSVSIKADGNWALVGEKLVLTIRLPDETSSFSSKYSIRGEQLTLVNDDESVEVYRRL